MYCVRSFQPTLYHTVLYGWTVYHPQSLSLLLLAFMSALKDACSGRPLGQSFAQMFLLMLLVLLQRPSIIRTSFWVSWAFESVFMALITLVPALLAGSIQAQGIGVFVVPWFVSVCAYPVVYCVFQYIIFKSERGYGRELP